MLEAYKQLSTLNRDEFLVASLAIKAGIEEADAFMIHLAAMVEKGKEAAFELRQLMNPEPKEEEEI